jgi:3'(2'), 5'-bisphosphate nucleotidase
MLHKVIEISQTAGSEIMKFYNDPVEVEFKSDESPLTKADLAANRMIVQFLQREFPEIPIVSEEGGIVDYKTRKQWKQYWLVDPLDGTKEFIKKNGEFTVNIALIEDNVPVLGVVYQPAKEITYYSERGIGAYKIDSRGNTIRIYSDIPDRNKPMSVITSRSHRADNLEERLNEMGIQIGSYVASGSSIKFCLVAEGVADIYPRTGPTSEWDTAAGDAIYRYSGKNGDRISPLLYNKESLRNPGFIIGLE